MRYKITIHKITLWSSLHYYIRSAWNSNNDLLFYIKDYRYPKKKMSAKFIKDLYMLYSPIYKDSITEINITNTPAIKEYEV